MECYYIQNNVFAFHMDITKYICVNCKKTQHFKLKIQLLENIIYDLTKHFNTNNTLIQKYKTGKDLFDDMVKSSIYFQWKWSTKGYPQKNI